MQNVHGPRMYSFLPPEMVEEPVKVYDVGRDDENKNDGIYLSDPIDSTITSLAAMKVPKVKERRDISKFLPKHFIEGGNDYLIKSPREVWNVSSGSPVRIYSSLEPQKNLSKLADPDADICYHNMTLVDTFFRENFSRYPVHESVHLMRSYVHVSKALNRAYWDPSTTTVYYGEVDPKWFAKSFITCLDITTHEWTHAVTQFSSDLFYMGESGSLNESVSDVFAAMMLQFQAKSRANDPDAEWLIGKGLIAGYPKAGVRSLKAPGTAFINHSYLKSDLQPDHMRSYNKLPENEAGDWGGVHRNCGIPSRAFYFAATALQGNSWEKAGKIWFETLMKVEQDANFSDFAQATLSAVETLGYDQNVYQCVAKAWTEVGVDLRGQNLKPLSRKSPNPHKPFQEIMGPIPERGWRDRLISRETALGVCAISLSILFKYRYYS